jgi:hypothetical protein
MVRVYHNLYTCLAAFKRSLEVVPPQEQGMYWHPSMHQHFYFIISAHYWSGEAPRSFVGCPLVRWRNWIAYAADDIHDALEIMDRSCKIRLGGHPFEVIDLTVNLEIGEEAIINLTDDEEDYVVWRGTGSAEDPFLIDDTEEFVLMKGAPA